MGVDALFVDTNVLLAAVAPARPYHSHALRVLDSPSDPSSVLYVSGQVLREFMVVSTRPAPQNGLGLDVAATLRNLDAVLRRVRLLPEDARVAETLRVLVQATRCAGRQIHDANIVATMRVHDLSTLVTANTGDFARFRDHIEVRDLERAGGDPPK
jgi:predicted nucleic acid-binding protein